MTAVRGPIKTHGMSDNTPVLTGWKAIAGHLKRDERTAMRWASERGLPVRRVPGGKRGPVYARPEEIALWLASGLRNSDPEGGRETFATAVGDYENLADTAPDEAGFAGSTTALTTSIDQGIDETAGTGAGLRRMRQWKSSVHKQGVMVLLAMLAGAAGAVASLDLRVPIRTNASPVTRCLSLASVPR